MNQSIEPPDIFPEAYSPVPVALSFQSMAHIFTQWKWWGGGGLSKSNAWTHLLLAVLGANRKATAVSKTYCNLGWLLSLCILGLNFTVMRFKGQRSGAAYQNATISRFPVTLLKPARGGVSAARGTQTGPKWRTFWKKAARSALMPRRTACHCIESRPRWWRERGRERGC